MTTLLPAAAWTARSAGRSASTERGGRRRLRIALACAAAVTCVGCADRDLGRHRVQGTVRYQGKPVPLGRILFEPDANRGNQGPQGFAIIEAGRFDTRHRFCRGVVAGPTIVRIDGFAIDPAARDASTAGRQLFETYETRLDLPPAASWHDFDVPSAPQP